MLTIFGKPNRNGGICDGVTRRDFLTIGGSVLGGLTLPQLLRAEAQQTGAARSTNHKAIINIYLPGGPPHLDMWDIKTDAPREIRGEFNPIRTNVPGIEICELFPRIARMADKFIFVRSIADSDGGHDGYQCMTGRKKTAQTANFWPMMGSWVSKFQGPVNQSIPPNLSLMYPTGESRWGDPYNGGFLGMGHNPFNLVGRRGQTQTSGMTLNGITLERLNNRVSLLRSFDDVNRQIDSRGTMDGMDSFTAAGPRHPDLVPPGGRPGSVEGRRSRRGQLRRQRSGIRARRRPRMIRNFCIARRLVEAGARVVTLNFSRWDWHGRDGKNFVESRKNMPLLDQGVAALVNDLARPRAGSGRVGRGLGRIRPDAAHQQHRRPRPLAAELTAASARRRRHEDRPGHRRHRSHGRLAGPPSGQVPGSLRHPLSQHRPQPERNPHLRPERPAAVPGRLGHRPDAGSGVRSEVYCKPEAQARV